MHFFTWQVLLSKGTLARILWHILVINITVWFVHASNLWHFELPTLFTSSQTIFFSRKQHSVAIWEFLCQVHRFPTVGFLHPWWLSQHVWPFFQFHSHATYEKHYRVFHVVQGSPSGSVGWSDDKSYLYTACIFVHGFTYDLGMSGQKSNPAITGIYVN